VDWNDDTGTPTKYYVRTIDDDRVIGLYPNPTVAKEVRIYYTKIPATIAVIDTATYPEIRSEYHLALPHYAASMYYMRMQESVETRSRSAGHMNQFLGLAARAKMSTISETNDDILVWGADGINFNDGSNSTWGLGSTIRASDFD
jgi:hypothetical protein